MTYKFNNNCDCCGKTKQINKIARTDSKFINEFGYICKNCYYNEDQTDIRER